MELCYEFSPLSSSAAGNPRGSRGAGGAPAPAVPAGPPLEGGAGLRVLRALRPFPGSQEGRQEDAEEFLGCLLNSLNDEMLEVGLTQYTGLLFLQLFYATSSCYAIFLNALTNRNFRISHT